MSNLEYCIKVILIGPTLAGKSSLLKAVKYEDISSKHITTIGVDYDFIRRRKGNNNYKLCFWDTAGYKSFHTITKSYYNSSVVCIIMFDLTSLDSFKEAMDWLNEYRTAKPNDLVVLVGNKLDKIVNNTNNDANESQITYGNIGKQNIQPFIDEHNVPYIEISTSTRHNVEELISFIISDTSARIESGQLSPNSSNAIKVQRYVKGQWIPYIPEEKKKKSWFSF